MREKIRTDKSEYHNLILYHQGQFVSTAVALEHRILAAQRQRYAVIRLVGEAGEVSRGNFVVTDPGHDSRRT